ncbi:glycoside hydrolase family protein [Pseudodesulfovibrio sp.]|uniref:glycoside hydrolase family protein n=1 Tax=Pseudodesulfovibrio sp. TaxID=2035812 RepID=UPI00341981DA
MMVRRIVPLDMDIYCIGGACTQEDYDKYKDGWSKEKAQEMFENDVKTHEEIVKKYVKVDLSQGEYDALTHFVFNVGGIWI